MTLVQALKYEAWWVKSPLMDLLLDRAKTSAGIAYRIFWHVKTELSLTSQPWYRSRYIFWLKKFITNSDFEIIKSLLQQIAFAKELSHISEMMNEIRIEKENKTTKKKIFENLLLEITSTLPKKFEIPLNNSKNQYKGINVNNCKIFSSKKKPMLITMINEKEKEERNNINNINNNNNNNNNSIINSNNLLTDPLYTNVIFKSGDDLRQDMVILKLISMMCKIFEDNDLYLPMLTYDCVCMSPEEGYIQVVPNSQTISKIQMEFGGSSAVFKENTIRLWLLKNNPTFTSMSKAVGNFILSCAGYCVATYILGVGDRHNDNIMLTKNGLLFHIDFGHFLGNIKRKFGIKRERNAFILTSDFVNVMQEGESSVSGGREEGERGRENFENFVKTCLKAFTLIRRNNHLIFNILRLMIHADLPQLKSEHDLDYIRSALFLDKTEEESQNAFHSLILETLNSEWSTHLMWYFHTLKHQ
eukprot:Lithocolla_globosa_v1_NODE_3423_length_1674_cov_21.474985.p1 type:complete len:473 gc:universal NODE_3423_length_1674_cov_21.474985:198-1616(+)